MQGQMPHNSRDNETTGHSHPSSSKRRDHQRLSSSADDTVSRDSNYRNSHWRENRTESERNGRKYSRDGLPYYGPSFRRDISPLPPPRRHQEGAVKATSVKESSSSSIVKGTRRYTREDANADRKRKQAPSRSPPPPAKRQKKEVRRYRIALNSLSDGK